MVANVSLEAFVTKEKKLVKITVISDLNVILVVVRLLSAQTFQHVFLNAQKMKTVKRDVVHSDIAHQLKIFAKLGKRWIMTIVMQTLSVNHEFVSIKNALLRLQ